MNYLESFDISMFWTWFWFCGTSLTLHKNTLQIIHLSYFLFYCRGLLQMKFLEWLFQYISSKYFYILDTPGVVPKFYSGFPFFHLILSFISIVIIKFRIRILNLNSHEFTKSTFLEFWYTDAPFLVTSVIFLSTLSPLLTPGDSQILPILNHSHLR